VFSRETTQMSVMQRSGMDSSSPVTPPAPPVSEYMLSKATSVTGMVTCWYQMHSCDWLYKTAWNMCSSTGWVI